jgi:hypothetical protein
MRENCTSGSVAGAPGNRSPYAGGNSLSSLLPAQGFQGETVGCPLLPLVCPLLPSVEAFAESHANKSKTD